MLIDRATVPGKTDGANCEIRAERRVLASDGTPQSDGRYMYVESMYYTSDEYTGRQAEKSRIYDRYKVNLPNLKTSNDQRVSFNLAESFTRMLGGVNITIYIADHNRQSESNHPDTEHFAHWNHGYISLARYLGPRMALGLSCVPYVPSLLYTKGNSRN